MWISGLKRTTGVSCSVFGKKGKDAVEDSACAMVRFAGGACLMLEVNWNLRDPRDVVYLQVYGAKGAGVLSPLQVHKSIQGVLVNCARLKQKNYYKDIISLNRSLHPVRAQTEGAAHFRQGRAHRHENHGRDVRVGVHRQGSRIGRMKFKLPGGILPPLPLILPAILSGALVTLCFPVTSLGPCRSWRSARAAAPPPAGQALVSRLPDGIGVLRHHAVVDRS
jgi:hypothetical protein